ARCDARMLSRCKTRDRYAERRTRYIVELGFVAEGNRSRVATMLTADADLELRTRLAAALDPDLHEFTDTLRVERYERIDRQNSPRGVNSEKARRVVARNAEGRLREIVGAEQEELRGLGDFA